MKGNFIFEPEPDLFFGVNQRDKASNIEYKNYGRCVDPRIGLLNFGPSGLSESNRVIKIAMITDRKTNYFTNLFFNLLKTRILGQPKPDSNIRSIDFPGVYEGGEIGFHFEIDNELIPPISDNEIDKILSKDHRFERVKSYVSLIDQYLEDVSELQNRPLILIPIPKKILGKCIDPQIKEQRIKLWGRNFRDLRKYLQLEESERPILFDFHNYIKVLGFKYRIPTQVIKPDTLEFSSNQEHDPATVAWNFSISLYYKYSEKPWKLADINPETIHVGVSFYFDISTDEKIVKRAAVAQVYMRDSDSQIVRGLEIPVDDVKESLKDNISKEQAADILNKAIDLFKRTHYNRDPVRLVLHKTSPYNEDERIGFSEAASGIEQQNYLHIQKYPDIRILPSGDYPITRGSVLETITHSKKTLDIYTTGYIPALATYTGSQIPAPIRVILDKVTPSNSPYATREIIRDILKLTKLDWNSTDFAKREPVTISVAKKVGDILGEINGRPINPPSPYSFYM